VIRALFAVTGGDVQPHERLAGAGNARYKDDYLGLGCVGLVDDLFDRNGCDSEVFPSASLREIASTE
jgi:hypothetical protein